MQRLETVSYMYDRRVPTRRSPAPEERRRDPERTRRLILDAASAEFGAHGYAGARIGAIASRAGVNVQLISYYFDGKEGLYQALSAEWAERRRDIVPPGTPLPEQLRRYAMEAVHNPEGARLLAWNGLEYTGPDDEADGQERHERMLADTVAELKAKQEAGELSKDFDPAALTVMLMAAAMVTTTLPHVIDGVCGTDPTSPVIVDHFADQVATLAKAIGL